MQRCIQLRWPVLWLRLLCGTRNWLIIAGRDPSTQKRKADELEAAHTEPADVTEQGRQKQVSIPDNDSLGPQM